MSYFSENGIWRPTKPLTHRNNEYDESHFDALLQMQSDHFWYVGRHKFLKTVLNKYLPNRFESCIDLGGGTGGWIKYLLNNMRVKCDEIAMGDSSEHALTIAKEILPDNVTYYQLDLMDLKWQERWDVVFLLDVIEHCPNDIEIMKQVFSALKPGGRLFITTPALMNFWSYNDVLANHLKRYNKSDFEELAKKANLKLIDSYYFMFFLSPLYWLVRKFKFSKNKINLERAFKKNHRTPNIVVNYILSLIFLAESYIGLTMRFPWGTSIVGIFEKPKFDKPPFGVQDSNL